MSRVRMRQKEAEALRIAYMQDVAERIRCHPGTYSLKGLGLEPRAEGDPEPVEIELYQKRSLYELEGGI